MTKRAQEAQESHATVAARQSQPPPDLAANIVRLRQRKGLSAQQLASSAGIALSTVQELEAGEHEPNIKTLWSLATALGVPFSALISPKLKSDGDGNRASSNVRSRKVLSSKDGGRNSEVYELKLAAGASQVASARAPGARENILVTKGAALITTVDGKHTLRTGESATFAADSERSYAGLDGDEATLYIVVSQPAR